MEPSDISIHRIVEYQVHSQYSGQQVTKLFGKADVGEYMQNQLTKESLREEHETT